MTGFVEDRSILSRSATPPDAVVRYGARDENVADIRYGQGSATDRPLILFIHGGFWRPQFDRTHAGPLCDAVAVAGWTIASIEYRRIPGAPDATLQDIQLAIERLPSLMKQHCGKAIAVGHSAGGHLVLWAAAQNFAKLSGVLALGAAADLQYGYAHGIGDHAVRDFIGGTPSDRRDIDPCQSRSPAINVTLVHGEQDAITSLTMAENYRLRHPQTRLVKLAACGHFAVIDPTSHVWPIVLAELDSLSRL